MTLRRPALQLALSICLLLSAGFQSPTLADDPKPNEAAKPKIDWIDGPVTARLGNVAQIKIPEGYKFTGKEGTRKFLELTQNPPNGSELGTIIPIVTKESSGGESHDFWFLSLTPSCPATRFCQGACILSSGRVIRSQNMASPPLLLAEQLLLQRKPACLQNSGN